jgi:RecB family exonuclease
VGISVEWVRYGTAAGEALRARIAAAKVDDPLSPVTVVVPSNHVGVATRRLLASGRLGPNSSRGTGLVGVSFLTPYRLAELFGAPPLAAAGRRPVSTPVIAAALRAELAHDAGVFGRVAAHPATESALVNAYRELRDLTDGALDALAGSGARAHDVVRLHRAARARLEPSWYDEQDLMSSAAAVVADAPPGTTSDLGHVVVYLPQRLSGHAIRLLSATARATEVSALAGATGDAGADAEVATSVRQLVPGAPAPPTGAPLTMVGSDRTRVITASDADDEVRHAVRAVVEAVRTGVPLDRIAVVHASPDPYGRLAHEHLTAAGIATNGAAVVPLTGRVTGRVLLDLLALPERQYRRQDVLTWMNAAPVHDGGRWAPVSAWERLSRQAGVVAGRHDWDAKLERLAHDLDMRAEADDGDPDAPAWRAERHRQEAGRARALRTFVLDLVDDLTDAARTPRPWGEHARWAKARLHRAVGDATRRTGWPVVESKAAERVEAALDRLGALDGVEGPVALDVFARTLALELESDLGRVGRFGDGVLVGSVAMAMGLDLHLLVVLGLAEGTFPGPVRDDSLLPDHEREATRGELPLRRTRVDREHRELLAGLAAATHHVLTAPRGDLRRSAERYPSRWLLDVASALAGTRWWADDLDTADDPWVEHAPSFDGGLRRLRFAATEQEHRLRELMAAAPAGARALSQQAGDPVLTTGAHVTAERRSDRFTRFDGNLGGLTVPSPLRTATSTSRLETWAGCPFAYLVQYVLGIEAVENPEEALQISPLDWGNLVHAALDRFMTEVLARAPADRPGPDHPWTPADRARMTEIGEALCDDYAARGLTGRPLLWRRDRARILADLQRFLSVDETERRTDRTHPDVTELAFGLRGADMAAVPLLLPDGRQLLFRGKADRIDVSDDGHLHVVDYKTGSRRKYEGLTAEDPDQRGQRLQLAVYGAAARQRHGRDDAPVTAEYWFVSAKGRFEKLGYDITDHVLAKVGQALGTIVDGIEAGVFPARPTAGKSTSPFVECPACDPDALGTSELRRAWEQKCRRPELTSYAHLAEPLEGATVTIDGRVEEPADA